MICELNNIYRAMRYFLWGLIIAVSVFIQNVTAQDTQNTKPFGPTLTAGFSTQKMFLSYSGIPNNDMDFVTTTPENYMLSPWPDSDNNLELISSSSYMMKIEKYLQRTADRILQYFSVDNSTDGEVVSSLLKTHLPDDTMRKSMDYDFSLSFNVGYDSDQVININAVKVSSYLFSTYLDAVYDCRNSGLDLFFSNDYLNDYLLNGMKLEFQMSPTKSSGAVLVTMNF